MGSSNVTFPSFPSRKLMMMRSKAASQSYSLCLARMESRNSVALAGRSMRRFLQYLSLPSASHCSMMQLTMVSFSTICSLMSPRTAIFMPSSLGITLGIMTPGVSTRNMRGLLRILKPKRPRVVQTEAEALAAARLFSRSEMLRIWLMMEDLPTLGAPQASSHRPTCLYLWRQFSLRQPSTRRMSSWFWLLTAKQRIPQSLQSLMMRSVLAASQRSYLLKTISFSFWLRLMMRSNSGFRLQQGMRASRISMNTSTLCVLSSICRSVFCMCPGNQFMWSFRFFITFILLTQIYLQQQPPTREHGKCLPRPRREVDCAFCYKLKNKRHHCCPVLANIR